MKIQKENGYIEVALSEDNTIWVRIGCDEFYPDGTRKLTRVNSVQVTAEEIIELFSVINPKKTELHEQVTCEEPEPAPEKKEEPAKKKKNKKGKNK